MNPIQQFREQKEYLGNRVDFRFNGWRRFAYWCTVMFIGVSIGVRYGHPELTMAPGVQLYDTPAKETAEIVANGFSLLAAILLVLIIGRDGFIRGDDDE